MNEITLLEGIRTLRAVREFTDEPVSDEQIATMLDLAACAPSGGNRQPWHFVVIRDPATRRAIRDHYLEVFRRYRQDVLRQAAEGHPAAQAQVARWERSGSPDAFAENLDRIPVLILVCLDRQRLGFGSADPAEPLPPTAWASIYPAVQNLLLAAHGLGLGAVLTTLHMPHEREVQALLGIPPTSIPPRWCRSAIRGGSTGRRAASRRPSARTASAGAPADSGLPGVGAGLP